MWCSCTTDWKCLATVRVNQRRPEQLDGLSIHSHTASTMHRSPAFLTMSLCCSRGFSVDGHQEGGVGRFHRASIVVFFSPLKKNTCILFTDFTLEFLTRLPTTDTDTSSFVILPDNTQQHFVLSKDDAQHSAAQSDRQRHHGMCWHGTQEKVHKERLVRCVPHIQPFVLPFSSAMKTTASPLHSQANLFRTRGLQELRDALVSCELDGAGVLPLS